MKGGKLSPVNSFRFKVNVADQIVYQERDAPLGPYKFNTCKVMDLQNWSCPYNDKSGEIGMGKGKYYEVYGEPDLGNNSTIKATGQVPCSADIVISSGGRQVQPLVG